MEKFFSMLLFAKYKNLTFATMSNGNPEVVSWPCATVPFLWLESGAGGNPEDEAGDGSCSNEDEPEPEEDEDDLVEEVHGKGALHAVSVDVAQHPDVEVADRHSREPV